MNIIVKNKLISYYEGIMRYDKKIHTYDIDNSNNPFPFPQHNPKYNNSKILSKLINLELLLVKQNNYDEYKKIKSCPICGLKNISTIIYSVANIYWDDGLKHHIAQHYYKPSDDFINFLNHTKIKNNQIKYTSHNHKEKEKILFRMNGYIMKRNKKTYVKISRNQLNILDALMIDGGFTKKYVDTHNKLRWSEHAGLLDFSGSKLDKIIVSGKTIRTDTDDHEIFLPLNMIEAYDYEYMFHTHPPTPYPGARAKEGIVYEFPSISDIFHFIEHRNNGNIQGSIIMAPEGIYIIRSQGIGIDDKIIIYDEDSVYNHLESVLFDIQDEALLKYGRNIKGIFYEKVVQDKTFIKKFNKYLKEYNIKILYKPRIKDKLNNWIIDNLNIVVNPIEPILIKK
jgi:hypothetical protein